VNLLLDTHALLWALSAPDKLGRAAARALRDPANRVVFSAASAWEIAIKAALGKLRADLQLIARAAHDADFEELSVTVGHTIRLRSLPPHHRDPFDRMLVAQALEDGLTVLTSDRAFDAYGVPTLFK
jgi:PIN domain nuclease of toxin-antitoxin system